MKRCPLTPAAALLVLFATTALSAQGTTAPGAPGTDRGRASAVRAEAPVAEGSDQPADQTRDQLQSVLEQYPPSLPQVLRLDPTLLANPGYLASLTLCDTQPSTPPGSAGTWDQRKAVVRKNGLAALADTTMQRWFTDEFKKVNPTRWREIRDTISGTTPEGSVGCMSAIQNFDYLDRLQTIKVPTLVICGDQDEGTPPDRNKLIASKIPGARYEGIANARHLPNVERPDQFNRIMMSFLAANR